MPEPGWKTIAVRDDLYDSVVVLAKELDRSISWVATKAIEYAVRECIRPDPLDDQGVGTFYDPERAEKLGLR